MKTRTERELLHEILRNQRMLAYAVRNVTVGKGNRIVSSSMQDTMNRIERVLIEEGTHY